MNVLSNVEGIVTADKLADTVDAIAAIQLPDGNIPWIPGHHTDPWNLVEAAMALDVGGRHTEAERAYEWLRSRQRPDGAWHAYYVCNDVKDPTLDTNAVVERAIDYVLDYQTETGEVAWRGDDPDDGALLTGSSSVHASLRCAIAIAEHLGHERPDWELSLGSLAIAVAHRPDVFLDKARWAMDWYYPILGGVLRGHAAHARVASGWKTFVVEGRGARCVSDRPWVTAAETCELVMALDVGGRHTEAERAYEWLRSRQRPDGAWHAYYVCNDVKDPTLDTNARPLPRRAPGGRRRHRSRDGPRQAELNPPQHAEAAGRRHRREGARCDGALPHLERRLAAVARVLEHVVEDEHAARRDVRRPGLVVGEHHVQSVTAVDEHEPERRAPVRGDRGRVADDGDHGVLESGVLDRAAEERQRVHAAGLGIDDLGVVVLPPGLVLLRAAMVVDAEQHGAAGTRRRAQVHGRLAAVAADLEEGPDGRRVAAGGVEREPLVVGHEPLGGARGLEEAGVHPQMTGSSR